MFILCHLPTTAQNILVIFLMFYVLFEHCFTFELFGLMTAKLKYLLTYCTVDETLTIDSVLCIISAARLS